MLKLFCNHVKSVATMRAGRCRSLAEDYRRIALADVAFELQPWDKVRRQIGSFGGSLRKIIGRLRTTVFSARESSADTSRGSTQTFHETPR